MSCLKTVCPRAFAFVALGAAVFLGLLWVFQPFTQPPQHGVFGFVDMHALLAQHSIHLVNPAIVPLDQWQFAEGSARFAVLLATIAVVIFSSTWNSGSITFSRKHSHPLRTLKPTLYGLVLLLIVVSAAYPTLLVRNSLKKANAVPVVDEFHDPYPKPVSLTPAEQESMGREMSADDVQRVYLLTPLPFRAFTCPRHGEPLHVEYVPCLPGYPAGCTVREGFPFGPLSFNTHDISLPDWRQPVIRCPVCVTLNERFSGISQQTLFALSARKKHQR